MYTQADTFGQVRQHGCGGADAHTSVGAELSHKVGGRADHAGRNRIDCLGGGADAGNDTKPGQSGGGAGAHNHRAFFRCGCVRVFQLLFNVFPVLADVVADNNGGAARD